MTKISMAFALAAAAVASPALAEDAKPAPAEQSTPAAKSVFADATPVDEGKLAKIAGKEDLTQLTNSDQTNSVDGNSVGDNSNTGTISISDNAFNNMNGMTILNANTGNNVAINASIQVNIALPAQ